MLISMISGTQLRLAYSSRYTPAATPSGTAAKAVTVMTSSEPTQADRMPACEARREAKFMKKSRFRRSEPRMIMSETSRKITTRPMARKMMPSAWKSVSLSLPLAISARTCSVVSGCILVSLAETAAQPLAEDVEAERDQQQGQAGSKNGLVADRAVRQISQRHLHDVGSDSGSRFSRVPGQVGLHARSNSEDHRFTDGARDTKNVRSGQPGN